MCVAVARSAAFRTLRDISGHAGLALVKNMLVKGTVRGRKAVSRFELIHSGAVAESANILNSEFGSGFG